MAWSAQTSPTPSPGPVAGLPPAQLPAQLRPVPASPGTPPPVTFGKILPPLESVEDLDAVLGRLRNLIWTLHYYSYPNGQDRGGRTLPQDVDQYLLPSGHEAQFKQLRVEAVAATTRGDREGLRKSLDAAHALLSEEVTRAGTLWAYATAGGVVTAHHAAWLGYAERASAEERAASQARITAAASAYGAAVDAALIADSASQPAAVEGLQQALAALISAYNTERGALAARLSDEDRAAGKLTAAYVRQGSCPQPASRTSGRTSPWFGEVLRNLDEYYPEGPRKLSFEGRVVLTLFISETGCLERAEIFQSSGVPEFDQAALRWAAEGVTWLPAERDGKAASASVKLPVKFALALIHP
jgi:TonB family protein